MKQRGDVIYVNRINSLTVEAFVRWSHTERSSLDTSIIKK